MKYSSGPLYIDEQKQDNQLEPTCSSSVPIRDVALKTCRKQWMVGRGGERESGISVLMVWHGDDDDYFFQDLILKVNCSESRTRKKKRSVYFFCRSSNWVIILLFDTVRQHVTWITQLGHILAGRYCRGPLTGYMRLCHIQRILLIFNLLTTIFKNILMLF